MFVLVLVLMLFPRVLFAQHSRSTAHHATQLNINVDTALFVTRTNLERTTNTTLAHDNSTNRLPTRLRRL